MTNDSVTVVGVFSERGQAEAAMDELRHARFPSDQIGFISPTGSGTVDQTPIAKIENNAESGATTGAVAGGALGAVAGAAAAVLVPGIGHVIAGGILLAMLGGAAAGAAAGTYVGPFIGMGLSQEDARSYEQEIHSGRTVVTVRTTPDSAAQAAEILHNFGAMRVQGPVSVSA